MTAKATHSSGPLTSQRSEEPGHFTKWSNDQEGIETYSSRGNGIGMQWVENHGGWSDRKTAHQVHIDREDLPELARMAIVNLSDAEARWVLIFLMGKIEKDSLPKVMTMAADRMPLNRMGELHQALVDVEVKRKVAAAKWRLEHPAEVAAAEREAAAS